MRRAMADQNPLLSDRDVEFQLYEVGDARARCQSAQPREDVDQTFVGGRREHVVGVGRSVAVKKTDLAGFILGMGRCHRPRC